MKKWIGLLLLFAFAGGNAYGDNFIPDGIPHPYDIAVDASGTLYVTDTYSYLLKITPAGVVTNLLGLSPRPNIGGIAADKSGNVYVTDETANVIWKISPEGVWSIFAGSSGVAGSANGTGTAATFREPKGIAIDGSGNFYVADMGNALIRKISPKGVVTTLAGGGKGTAANGKGAAASFNTLTGIGVDKTGNVYVADYGSNMIRKITPGGVVTTLAGTEGVNGAANGTGKTASFSSINGIAVDPSGNVYVADKGNALVRKITSRGLVTTLAGALGTVKGQNLGGFADGTGTSALFHTPYGVAVDPSGSVYVADFWNNSIRKINPKGVVTTVAGSRPGAAGNSTASVGTGVAVTSAGNGTTPANSSAPAGPITLVCTPATGKGDPAQMILNEAAGTADFGSDPVTTATFNETTVWWKVVSQDPNYQIEYQKYYTLSRLTGVLTFYTSRGTTDNAGNTKWAKEQGLVYNCKVGVEKRLF